VSDLRALKRTPTPKLVVLLLKVSGSVYESSDWVYLRTDGNRYSFPNENFYFAVDWLMLSFNIKGTPSFEMVMDIVFNK